MKRATLLIIGVALGVAVIVFSSLMGDLARLLIGSEATESIFLAIILALLSIVLTCGLVIVIIRRSLGSPQKSLQKELTDWDDQIMPQSELASEVEVERSIFGNLNDKWFNRSQDSSRQAAFRQLKNLGDYVPRQRSGSEPRSSKQ